VECDQTCLKWCVADPVETDMCHHVNGYDEGTSRRCPLGYINQRDEPTDARTMIPRYAFRLPTRVADHPLYVMSWQASRFKIRLASVFCYDSIGMVSAEWVVMS
jgi:hypothetical protein